MKYTILICFIFLIFSCANTQQNEDLGYSVYQDPYKGFTRFSVLYSGSLDGQGFLDLSFVTMDVFVDRHKDRFTMSMAIIYEGESWLFINEGESLVLNIDGEMLPLSTYSGSWYNREVKYGGRVREEAHYPFTPEQLHKVNKASKITLRIYGKEGWIERRISEKQREYLRLFEQKFIIPNDMKSV